MSGGGEKLRGGTCQLVVWSWGTLLLEDIKVLKGPLLAFMQGLL
jgi:hypothetical protein